MISSASMHNDLSPRGPGWWSLGELRSADSVRRLRWVLVFWLAIIAVSLAFGIANVLMSWNGSELALFGLPLQVTLYPPFLLSVLVALWIGPGWAIVPIYLANLASALASGMDWPMALIFALAGAIETLILWGALVALRVDPDLRRGRDLAWFVAAGLVAAVTGSLAAILWNSSHQLDPTMGQRIWRGWVTGDFLQLVVVAIPLLRFVGPHARPWIDRQFVNPPRREFNATHGVALTVLAFAILGLVVFLGVYQALGSIEVALDARTTDGELLLPKLREIVLAMGLLSTALILATGIFSTALARIGERQRREALIDGLTGCWNRRAFGEAFAREAERSRRLDLGLGLMFVDLDHFKRVNDQYGHEVGDLALARSARRIEGSLRETDLLFRWGGEEFVVLVAHSAADEVRAIAERIRQALEEAPLAPLPGGDSLSLTASVGGIVTRTLPQDPAKLLRRADEACYRAKAAGRNRVELVSDPP
ncbi:MAG: GGDEF domain-containing protein [Acidobacteriota bacterium]